jgi:hypothetical protein
VLVEEVYQEHGETYQVNTYFTHGVPSKPVTGMQKPAGSLGESDQFHASGTHIHIQPGNKFSVRARYTVSLRQDGQPGSEQHLNDGTIYKGALENGQPAGLGHLIGPDGTIREGTFKDGGLKGAGKITAMAGGLLGRIYEGTFIDGELNGPGKITYSVTV